MTPRRLGLATGVTITLAACSAGPIGTSPSSAGTIRIGIEFPLSGDDAADGLGAKNGVAIAIDHARRVCGASSHSDACFELQIAGYDDAAAGIHDPARGADNVGKLVADPSVLGIVGPLYDSLARTEIPVANQPGLAMVSPAATNECLTQEPSDGHCAGLAAKLRPKGGNNFFRVVTTQLSEGAAAGELAFKTLKKRRAYVINDGSAFGAALASGFANRFTADGGAILNAGDLGRFDPAAGLNASAVVNQARDGGADVLYLAAAGLETAGGLRISMAKTLPTVPLIGSDRLDNNQLAKRAGDAANGTYFTEVGPYAPKLASAQAFTRDYRAAHKTDPGRYSVAAFDATGLLLSAISRAIDGAGGKLPSRAQVRDEVALSTDFHGAMGVMSLDRNGDTSLKLLTAYEWLTPTDVSARFVAELTLR